ncbi:hypothetical protein ACFX13_010497 [Malus domestica]|uniref:cellulase n=1 Tax=Malus domestica TaxID=3750 RepID=A0A498IGC8_MALDO|nr:hypothetical protein DVH24_036581 [Malus domestica]
MVGAKGKSRRWVWVVGAVIVVFIAIAMTSVRAPKISFFGQSNKACNCTQRAVLEKLSQLRDMGSFFLPCNQRVTWRSNSGLYDGKANRFDLVGGYYDASDNMKFGLPRCSNNDSGGNSVTKSPTHLLRLCNSSDLKHDAR